jgi:hypothetical protein
VYFYKFFALPLCQPSIPLLPPHECGRNTLHNTDLALGTADEDEPDMAHSSKVAQMGEQQPAVNTTMCNGKAKQLTWDLVFI